MVERFFNGYGLDFYLFLRYMVSQKTLVKSFFKKKGRAKVEIIIPYEVFFNPALSCP